MYRVLLIDDDTEVLKLNRLFFEKNGCKAMICSEAGQAERIVKDFIPDCILLDVMMPEIDGFTLCRKIRKITNVPILFLSGKVSEEDKIKGFTCGADDYIEKPYSIKEVYIRVISNIKRSKLLKEESAKKTGLIEAGPVTIDVESHKVMYDEEEIQLTNREYDLLLYMAKHQNEEVTFEEIGKATWGTYNDEDRRSVMVNMSRLRKKLSEYEELENLIETVWSKGYKMTVK